MENKKLKNNNFKILLFGVCIGIILTSILFGSQMIKDQKEFDKYKLGNIELVKIFLSSQRACMDYANLTNEEFQEVFLDWGINKIKLGEDPFS